MSKSDYLEGEVIGWLRGTAFADAPTKVYVSLHTGDPGEDGSNEHGATAAYARVEGDLDGGGNPASNSAAVKFAEATADYSDDISHFGFWDAATVGNFLGSGALGKTRTITEGARPTFDVGELTWTEG